MSKLKKKVRIEYPEQDTVKNQDWRLHAVTAVSKDTDKFKRGDVIKVRMDLRLKNRSNVIMGAPNVEALFLDLAAKLEDESTNLLAEIKKAAAPEIQLSDTLVFDCLEKRMASAIFAFTAIESFSNEVIAHAYSQGYQFEQKQKSGVTEKLDLEKAHWLGTDEKISKILPSYLKIATPKGTHLWDEFKRLKKIRNRIVHLKGPDRGNSVDRWLWEELFDVDGRRFSEQAYDLIGHFTPHIEGLNLRWHYKWPHSAKTAKSR